jgi:hypothetical protein
MWRPASSGWDARSIPEREVGLICLPIYHIAAYTNMLYAWTTACTAC